MTMDNDPNKGYLEYTPAAGQALSEAARINAMLDEKIPRSAVMQRDGGGGRSLSYLSGHYVIDRLNQVFGPLNWANEITEVREITGPVRETTSSKPVYPAYLVKLRLSVMVNGMTTVKEGYGYGSDKSAMNPHELAIKEAVTDALKVAAKNLGMSMGLALYDKSQENVEDDEPRAVSRPASSNSNPGGASNRAPAPKPAAAKPVQSNEQAKSPQSPSEEADLAETIRSFVRLADKLKKQSVDQFKQYLTDKYKVATVKELTKEQMSQLLVHLQELTK